VRISSGATAPVSSPSDAVGRTTGVAFNAVPQVGQKAYLGDAGAPHFGHA
jgi:hypothetical protein